MKLSSISLIAAALATIADTTAAPAPPPFERDVDIYSRTNRVSQSVTTAVATESHRKGAVLSRSALDCAHAAGLHDLAEHLRSNIKWNDEQYSGHHSGTAGASTITRALESQRLALGIIDHKNAADISLEAAACARRVGWQRRAKFHEDEAKAHHEHMKSLRHDPLHANGSREAARTTCERVKHEESSAENQKAAHVAGHRGLRGRAQHHDDHMNKNIGFITSDRQDPHYADTSKAEALETIRQLSRRDFVAIM